MPKDPVSGYRLSRAWFDWCFENPEKISPNHSAIYFFAIEHCNRLGWKTKFGFPTQMVMDAIGIKKHSTYIKYFMDLVEWGFFDLIQKSSNQYSSNIISIQTAILKNGKALDKALITHTAKQTEKQYQPIGKSKRSIDKQDNQITINNKQEVTDSIFGDELFVADLVRNHPGKDLRDAWEQCWIYFSQQPTKLLEWEWRQKYASWLIRYKPQKNGKDVNGKTKLVQ